MDDCKTDACVVNGRGYGEGFGLLTRAGADAHLTDRDSLFAALAAGVNGRKNGLKYERVLLIGEPPPSNGL